MYASSVRKLETSLLKYYVVNAIQNNRSEKVTEFFEKMTPELQHQAEWKDWFGKLLKFISFLKTLLENLSKFSIMLVVFFSWAIEDN